MFYKTIRDSTLFKHYFDTQLKEKFPFINERFLSKEIADYYLESGKTTWYLFYERENENDDDTFYYRLENILGIMGILDDPDALPFEDESEIIGIFEVRNDIQRKGNGSTILKYYENNIVSPFKNIIVHPAIESINFYLKNGYNSLPFFFKGSNPRIYYKFKKQRSLNFLNSNKVSNNEENEVTLNDIRSKKKRENDIYIFKNIKIVNLNYQFDYKDINRYIIGKNEPFETIISKEIPVTLNRRSNDFSIRKYVTVNIKDLVGYAFLSIKEDILYGDFYLYKKSLKLKEFLNNENKSITVYPFIHKIINHNSDNKEVTIICINLTFSKQIEESDQLYIVEK